MTDEFVPLEPITEIAPKPFNVSEELQKAITAATQVIEARSFSERHPELGKMVNCPVCSTRHRKNERKCEQVFTYRVGDFEIYRMDETTNQLVPDYRTAMRPDEKPTRKQVMGAASFVKKRFHPHPSKVKLQFIERTRKIFLELDFELLDKTDQDFKSLPLDQQKEKSEAFEKNLQRSRVLAGREIRSERELKDRAARRRMDQSRRINRGLLAH
jgi:hypothetical protein